MTEPETRLVLEAPGGLVEVVAQCRGGKAERITVRNVPSFADRLGASLEVAGLGTLEADTAYGGDSFAIVDAARLGFALTPDEARDLAETGIRITRAANEQLGFRHPGDTAWNHISFCQIAASDSHAPIAGANVGCEQLGGGASAMPADAGTVTRADGTFELTGISPGPLSIRIDADGYDEKIEAGMTATDGASLGPITVELTRATGEAGESHLELVGIGVGLRADGDALRVTSVIPGSGAFDAGVGSGDRIVAVDGAPVAPIGLEGAIAKIRGLPGTTVTITLRRDGGDVLLVIERRKIRT
jgi:uncharacterized metal-binding protein